ncbi:MAG: hypothetical protein AAGI51_02340 [Pseudomonadota bacterium]
MGVSISVSSRRASFRGALALLILSDVLIWSVVSISSCVMHAACQLRATQDAGRQERGGGGDPPVSAAVPARLA